MLDERKSGRRRESFSVFYNLVEFVWNMLNTTMLIGITLLVISIAIAIIIIIERAFIIITYCIMNIIITIIIIIIIIIIIVTITVIHIYCRLDFVNLFRAIHFHWLLINNGY